MFSPDIVLAAAAGAVVVASTAFLWSAARSIRTAADSIAMAARLRPRPPRPEVPLPPRRPDWARDTTQAMPLVPPPAGGLRGPIRPTEG